MSDATPPGVEAATGQISERAAQFIIAQEVESPEVYARLYSHPTWPGEGSGVTIGVGYDLGYTDAKRFAADWSDHLGETETARLAHCCGVKAGAAEDLLPTVVDVVVPWDAAEAVFRTRTVVDTTNLTIATFPGAGLLPPDCLGALVSLIYNRGPSLADPDRRREMRQIKATVEGNHPLMVPDLLRSMKRLWIGTSIERGMTRRREAEADLFASGLALSHLTTAGLAARFNPPPATVMFAPQPTADDLNAAELSRVKGA